MDDDTLIASEIACARAHQAEISDACARMIATQYADGTDGASFAATGAISDPSRVWRDLFTLPMDEPMYPYLKQSEQDKADMLGTYLTSNGTRGPVTGWPALWLRLGSGY